MSCIYRQLFLNCIYKTFNTNDKSKGIKSQTKLHWKKSIKELYHNIIFRLLILFDILYLHLHLFHINWISNLSPINIKPNDDQEQDEVNQI